MPVLATKKRKDEGFRNRDADNEVNSHRLPKENVDAQIVILTVHQLSIERHIDHVSARLLRDERDQASSGSL